MAQVVSVHSYRGGTGKSNTVSNLAVILAQKGYRVAVVDTDIQSPGVHVLFGFGKENIQASLNDYLWGKIDVKDAVYDISYLLTSGRGGGLFLLPSSIKTSDIARVLREGYDVNRLNDGYRKVIKDFKLDYLIIDTHPGLNEETLLSITISDVLLLLLRPDQQDYQGTAVTVDVARKLQVERLLIAVNKAPDVFDPDELKARVQSTYNADVAGVIPHSDDLMVLASSGIFVLNYPDHPVTRILETIAETLIP
ncbi:CDP-3,6-dideoxy-D-glycero-L-glycero-4-hexulose-4-reductase [Leptolyngbya sp. BL0902]|uniref:MinD/ParA family ATP-binding protein n=1 Tax=Leptolyngbya sp. BL0902 TaxID=1115757 RepID=UPI0018E7D6B8|nr:MinD/ParA family protein [Leptolyngbya sp. BL0902]QQE65945.1 CDP-3,6-dideoxy-D-glycero-L-glycero-4-hexulose-4-reductase [Leptolyngbya sp. BL0902]